MKYIIADPDEQSRAELNKILNGYKYLAFQGSFSTLEAAEEGVRAAPPDIAFIRIGKAELNAYKLTGTIREQNPLSKIIFFSHQVTYAIEAFEYEADRLLLVPFNREKIMHLLQKKY